MHEKKASGNFEKKRERQLRLEAVRIAEQSEMLEGYEPLTSDDGLPYELQQKWVNSEITSDEAVEILIKNYSDR